MQNLNASHERVADKKAERDAEKGLSAEWLRPSGWQIWNVARFRRGMDTRSIPQIRISGERRVIARRCRPR